MSEADSANQSPRLPRVAILGGGAAGVSAAFELSSGEWRSRYESISVYQYGHRLGGKGASGRGQHDRIEEHGLHIWLGFYENAFRLMRECYDELGDQAANHTRGSGHIGDDQRAIRTVEDAFERSSLFIMQEPRGDGWLPWFADFPETSEMPGSDDAADHPIPSLFDLVKRALRLSLTFMRSTESGPGSPPTTTGLVLVPEHLSVDDDSLRLEPVVPSVAQRVESSLRQLYLQLWYAVSDLKQTALAAAIVFAESLPDDPDDHDAAHHDLLRGLVERAGHWLRELHARPDDLSDQARREWYLTDIMLAVVRGLLHDGVLTHPEGLDAIDDHDFVEWLIIHGATPESARCGMVTTLMYDLPFAYRDGDPHQPCIAAGAALRGAFRTLFTYRGAVAWKMRAGMGDIVFAPMWEVLNRRGVGFEFFHRIDQLHLSPDGARITSIDVSRQVDLADGVETYDPLIDVRGVPSWPSQPKCELLAEPVTATDVESFWSKRKPAASFTLHDGADYDIVVLAIPVGAHPYVCGELIDRYPRWKSMVEQLGTINTQAFQLWLNVPMEDLGCDWPQATTGGYFEPFDTYADMRQLIPRESFPDGSVQAVAYFCNAMPTPPGALCPDDVDLPARADAQVRANAIGFLDEAIAPLWPGAVRRYPTAFRWELLYDDDDREGEERFDAQFHRANVDPSERYVLSLPGTARHRIAPGDSGVDNLFLAGDWTACGLNMGCVEAAVTSGLLAATAIAGQDPRRSIVGCRDGGRDKRGRHVW